MIAEGDIDLVCWDDVGYFFWKSDKAYQDLSPIPKKIILNYDPRDFQHNLEDMQKRFNRERANDLFRNILEEMGRDTHVFDVGGHVGRFGLPLGIHSKLSNLGVKVHIFEPGRTATLLSHSIRVNELHGIVNLVDAIATDYVGVGALRFDPAHLVSARAYVPEHDYITRLGRATTIDKERTLIGHTGPSLVKIDTEGHEVQVLKGCTSIISSGQFIISVEYRDWLMQHGAEILNSLFHASHVYDVGDNITLPYIEPVDALENYVKRIAAAKNGAGHTDILFISKTIRRGPQILDIIDSYREQFRSEAEVKDRNI